MSSAMDAANGLTQAGHRLFDAVGMISGAEVAVDEALALANMAAGETEAFQECAAQASMIQQVLEQALQSAAGASDRWIELANQFRR